MLRNLRRPRQKSLRFQKLQIPNVLNFRLEELMELGIMMDVTSGAGCNHSLALSCQERLIQVRLSILMSRISRLLSMHTEQTKMANHVNLKILHSELMSFKLFSQTWVKDPKSIAWTKMSL